MPFKQHPRPLQPSLSNYNGWKVTVSEISLRSHQKRNQLTLFKNDNTSQFQLKVNGGLLPMGFFLFIHLLDFLLLLLFWVGFKPCNEICIYLFHLLLIGYKDIQVKGILYFLNSSPNKNVYWHLLCSNITTAETEWAKLKEIAREDRKWNHPFLYVHSLFFKNSLWVYDVFFSHLNYSIE